MRTRREARIEQGLESARKCVRESMDPFTHSRRVKRWNGAAMVLRWVGTGLVKAENQFRRVKGYTVIPKLVAALENESLSQSKQTA